MTGGVDSKTATIGQGGTITLRIGDGNGNVSESVTLDISAEESTLEGIRDAINAAEIGITASIIDDGSANPYRLTLSSKETGTGSQISVMVNDTRGTALSDLLSYDSQTGSGAMQETVAARDAELTINGIDITSHSNVVEGAIQGVTLTLTEETTEPQALDVKRDMAAIKDALKEFVSAYNNLHSVQSELTAFNGPKANNGVLLGDYTARTVDSRLHRALNTPISGGDYFSLAQTGVTLQKDGTMKIDSDKLENALRTNLADVRTLLTGTETSQGLSAVLTSTIKSLAGDNGVLGIASEGLENRIDNLHERMEDMREHIQATIERYRAQFVQLDLIMA